MFCVRCMIVLWAAQLLSRWIKCGQSCRAVLQKYYIGELKQPAGPPDAHYEKQGEQDKFYTEIRKEVNAYFVENKVLTLH